ncbi:hypothetical protein MKW94_004599 [Papaver nudicaule]|uniref:ditrans,polycis-polyprenyl diphosphate synthase [(2E,6E)-farnesyldiphosphate specific] n=1 Tax=Papaver nudicaule TaxID=74823 RepID=A0AA41SCW9_PAPNU|nr:hypothetical protein [Papaver nudicaule]
MPVDSFLIWLSENRINFSFLSQSLLSLLSPLFPFLSQTLNVISLSLHKNFALLVALSNWLSESDENKNRLDQNQLILEFASFSDGKAGIAKASNLLCSKHLKIDSTGRNPTEPAIFTETDLAAALREVGHGGPEPSLLLTYGAVRCHQGFPAWRMRYTEILHMGPLKSMKYGALLKSIEEFTRVKQNYGA